MNRVSVIIPTWNRANTIEKAIYSALAQTLPPLEVLVCDDGSTDNTRELVQSIDDLRVRWLTGSRGGRPAIPRNRGIAESKGDWLAFLDSDDEWVPEKLEKQLHLAERLSCKAVCSNARRFIPGKGIDGDLLSWDRERITFGDLLGVNQVICSSTVVHSSLFGLVEGFPENDRLTAIEDYALWLRVATQTDFAFVCEPLLIYRDDPKASIRSEDTDVLEQRKCVFSDFKMWREKHDIPQVYLWKARRQSMADLWTSRKGTLLDIIVRLKRTFMK